MIDANKEILKILDIAPVPVIGWDVKGSIVYYNLRAASDFGWNYTYLPEVKINDLLNVDLDILPPGEAIIHSSKVKTLPGGERIFEWTSFFVNMEHISGLTIGKDITEVRIMQKRMEDLEKLASTGMLVTQISHEISNIVMGVMASFQSIIEKVKTDELYEEISEVKKTLERMVSLARTLILFTRKPRNRASVEITKIVYDVTNFVKHLIPTNVKLALELPENKIFADIPEEALYQILLNLLINARDAMNGYGMIRVVAKKEETGGKHIVRLEVSDSGEGMEEEIMKRIFEPFFTTKLDGTGIGLFTVHELVTMFGGKIKVKSKKGKGTSFRIYLPYTREETRMAEPTTRSLSILFIEDEESILKLGERILEKKGYRVLPAENGKKAMEIMKNFKFNVAVIDQTLPDISGRKLIELIRSKYPGSKILLSSGDVDPTLVTSVDATLQKPYTPAELILSIEKMIDRK
ncbi:response regulator [candidate division WOR-3 bacterium]|nr:response regulator [candidate division WOR-3 bacterium]